MKVEKSSLDAAMAAKYWGAKVTDQYAEGKTYKMVGLSEYDGNIQIEGELKDNDWWNISSLQLALKNLADISDEDAITIYEIIFGKVVGDKYQVQRNKTDTNIESIWNIDNTDENKVTLYIPHSLEIYYNSGGKISETDGERMREIIDFLRASTWSGRPKQAYDCDNLLASGVAVDVSTLKTEKI